MKKMLSGQIEENQLNTIRRYLEMESRKISDSELIATLRMLQHLKLELNLPRNIDMKTLIGLYQVLEDIREIFDMKTSNYNQLNEIYIELVTVRDMLDLPKDLSMKAVVNYIITFIDFDTLASLGIGRNSLLEKILFFYF